MRTFIFLLLIVGAGLFLYRGGFSLQSAYESDTGTRFSFPAHTTVTRDTPELIVISYPTPSRSQIQIYRIVPTNPDSSLSFSISRDFSNRASNEQSVDWGMRGIAFSWPSSQGTEKAFAFKQGNYVYIVTTFGADSKGLLYRDLQKVVSSLHVEA